MNKNAIKELTRSGCMMSTEAAKTIEPKDVELIKNLDPQPMYVTKKMIKEVRKSAQPAENQGNAEGQMLTHQSKTSGGEKSSAATPENTENTKQQNSNNVIVAEKQSYPKDTKVEILDHHDINQEEKDIPEFVSYFNDRYKKLKNILMRRKELQSATTINRLRRKSEGDSAATIGIVNNKYSTSTDKTIIEVEDKTGSIKVLLDESQQPQKVVPDEALGITGSMGDDIIFADRVIRPDMPIPDGVNTTKQDVAAAYISDLHIGSKDTMHDALNDFAGWLQSEAASKVHYLVIAGDLVEGVGVYPGQEEELEISDIYKQYEWFADWAAKIPDRIQIIIGPGNHDINRLSEPQPKIPEDALGNLTEKENVHRVQNPQTVRLHGIRSQGIKHVMYHGMSYDDHVDKIKSLRENAYDQPEYVLEDVLKRRHLAPSFGTNPLSPEGEDSMVIEQEPDVLVSGHFHSHCNESYKGVNLICSSSFQSQTDFQKRVGHDPQPGIVTVMNFKTRNTKTINFNENG